MRLPLKTLRRLGRATAVAAVIVAASGVLKITGWPLFAAIGEVALNLAAVRAEAEELRRKILSSRQLVWRCTEPCMHAAPPQASQLIDSAQPA